MARMIRLGLGYAGGAGARSDARRRERGPIVGCLCPLHGFLVVQIQLLPILCDADSIHPLVQRPHIIAAQILDVLGLLLDLWMLQGQAVVSGSFVFAAVVLPVIHVNMVQLQEAHEISGCLGFAFGDVVDPRSPEEEVTLLP